MTARAPSAGEVAFWEGVTYAGEFFMEEPTSIARS